MFLHSVDFKGDNFKAWLVRSPGGVPALDRLRERLAMLPEDDIFRAAAGGSKMNYFGSQSRARLDN